jgi:predicted secreted protein
MKKLLSLLLLAVAPVYAAAQQAYTDLNKPILVKANKPYFSIRLKANPTTGFNWLYDADNSSWYVTAVSEKYYPPVTKLVGAPGYSIWTFHVMPSALRVPSKLTVTLLYARPWDISGASKQSITIITNR